MSIELYRRAAAYARCVTADLAPADLLLPTPCPGWDVARVVLHLADDADAFLGLLATGELSFPEPARTAAGDPVSVLRERQAALDAALDAHGDGARAESAARLGAIELTTHGWDVGVARDAGHRVPEALAEEVLALVSSLLEDDARGDAFAPQVAVPADARASDRLVAFLGRSPALVVSG